MVENGGTGGGGPVPNQVLPNPVVPNPVVPNLVVAGWVGQLNELVQACEDDAALIDLLSSLEALKGASAGAQAAATVVFAGSQTAVGAAVETRPEVVRRSVCGQVALARRDSAHRGNRHVGLALALHAELPCTREALCAGRISEWQATLICRETACLDPELRREADARLAGRLGSLGDAGVAREAARVVAELDPAAVAGRAARAARDRKVTVRPAPDAMAYLTALLPAANAVACFAALGACATLAVGEGDGRGRGQIMADALTERLTGGAITGCDQKGRPIHADQEPGETDAGRRRPDPAESDPAESDPAESDPAASDPAASDPAGSDPAASHGERGRDGAEGDEPASPGGHAASSGVFDPVAALRAGRSGAGAELRCTCSCPCERCDRSSGSGQYRFPTVRDLREKLQPGARSVIRFNINVIMSDRTLWGHSDEPADLVGYGPIPADVARDLAAADLGPDVKTFLRRFYTAPQRHQLAAMDSTARFFSANMKQFMLVRDRECRTPYCHAPVRHADHGQDHAEGGPTDVDSNGTCRCEQCNHTKQAPGWRVGSRPDGVVVTTTPTGHSYESLPPTPPGAAPPARERPEPLANTKSNVKAKSKRKSKAKVDPEGKPKPWIVRAERAEPAAGPPESNDPRPQPRRSADSDPPRPDPPRPDPPCLDVVDLTRRFPDLAIEYRAA